MIDFSSIRFSAIFRLMLVLTVWIVTQMVQAQVTVGVQSGDLERDDSHHLRSPAALPVRIPHGYLAVARCSLAGMKNLTAVVDTGTTETVVDRRLATQLGLKLQADVAITMAGEEAVYAANVTGLAFGPIRVEALAIITADLSNLSRELGLRVDVVLGMDVLHRSSFTIDYKAGVMMFGPPAAMKYAAAVLPGTRVAVVKGFADGREVRLQVDTGFNSGLLLYGSTMDMVAHGFVASAEVRGATTHVPARVRELEVLRIGNWRVYQLPAAIVPAPREFVGFDGLFSPRAAGARRVGLNFEKQILSWE